MFRFKQTKGTYKYLIVGLGNPTAKYERTRHNAGFMCVDRIATKYKTEVGKKKKNALVGEVAIGENRCLLVKPLTFMNLSGTAVAEIASFYKIPAERILVIFDDTSFDIGVMRIKRNGSDGGHNGIKSIIGCLNSEGFPRLKIGIGKRPNPQFDLADWVLSRFNNAEMESLSKVLDDAVTAVETIVLNGIDDAMNKYNR